MEGDLLHRRAHDEAARERRGDMLILRGLAVASHTLGLTGKCDVVEFRADPQGVPLRGEEGLWLPYPVEYKRGKPKEHLADELQLCAQAMCLEEMLCCAVPAGALFYGEPRRRTVVEFTPELRQAVRDACEEMRQYARRGYTPKAKPGKALQRLLPERPVPAAAQPAGEAWPATCKAPWRNAMRHLLNTLFVTSEDIYLSLDGENVVANRERQEVARYPLHTLERHPLVFLFRRLARPHGRLRQPGIVSGVLHAARALSGARQRGKLGQRAAAPRPVSGGRRSGALLPSGARHGLWQGLQRPLEHRAHPARPRPARGRGGAGRCLRPSEGPAAADRGGDFPRRPARTGGRGARPSTLAPFDQMSSATRPCLPLPTRSRRPPLDAVNALLSFAYSLLAHDCAAALESVGLDAYVGFLHRDRPGRTSLALDLMEELRPCLADRFVLTLINNRVVGRADFDFRENGAVLLNDAGRRAFLKRWQERKQEAITHPYLKEKLAWGLVPYIQALLLARTLRGDLDGYPPFLWK